MDIEGTGTTPLLSSGLSTIWYHWCRSGVIGVSVEMGQGEGVAVDDDDGKAVVEDESKVLMVF